MLPERHLQSASVCRRVVAVEISEVWAVAIPVAVEANPPLSGARKPDAVFWVGPVPAGHPEIMFPSEGGVIYNAVPG